MQEPVYVLHVITCHGRIMPRLAELLLTELSARHMSIFQLSARPCPYFCYLPAMR